MKIFIYSALAATLCAAPAMAQPQEGANMFPAQHGAAPLVPAARVGEMNLQIKEDLQALAPALNTGDISVSGHDYIYGIREGYFGGAEWARSLSTLLNGTKVRVDDVRVLGRDGDKLGDNVNAVVVYSFQPPPNDNNPLPDFFERRTSGNLAI